MTQRDFQPPKGAIQAQEALEIAAPPEAVAAVYRAVDRWGQTFPVTIAAARVVAAGDNWQEIEVDHRMEGRVPNTLIFLSSTEIGLQERKRRFDASFLNRFEPAPGGTRAEISAYVTLNGLYRLFKPLLAGYVRRLARRQMRRYVLEPLKAAVEKETVGTSPLR